MKMKIPLYFINFRNGMILVFLFILFLIIYNHFIYNPIASPGPVVKELTNVQENALNKMGRMIELLISLATAVFAVIGFFTVDRFQSLNDISERKLFYGSSSLAFSALSIDYGYISMQKWVEILGNDMFNPFDPIIITPLNRQFYSFFISLIFLGLFILSSLKTSKSKIK